MLLDIKNHWFSDLNSTVCSCCFQTVPGDRFFRGSQRQTFITKLIWVSFSITFWITFSPKQVPKTTARFPPDRSLPRPCFSRNHRLLCRLDQVVFERSFVRRRLAHFQFFCFTKCYVSFNIFITLFIKPWKTPSRWSFRLLRKSAHIKNNNSFSYFSS